MPLVLKESPFIFGHRPVPHMAAPALCKTVRCLAHILREAERIVVVALPNVFVKSARMSRSAPTAWQGSAGQLLVVLWVLLPS